MESQKDKKNEGRNKKRSEKDEEREREGTRVNIAGCCLQMLPSASPTNPVSNQ